MREQPDELDRQIYSIEELHRRRQRLVRHVHFDERAMTSIAARRCQHDHRQAVLFIPDHSPASYISLFAASMISFARSTPPLSSNACATWPSASRLIRAITPGDPRGKS